MGKEKIRKNLAKDCIIWTMFMDSNNSNYWQQEYCKNNCQYKCLRNKDYKKGNY